MPTRKQSVTCKTCKWFEVVSDRVGICHLNPPLTTFKGKDVNRQLTAVFVDDWCSHHKGKR